MLWLAAQVPLAAINIHLDTSCRGALQPSDASRCAKPGSIPEPCAAQPGPAVAISRDLSTVSPARPLQQAGDATDEPGLPSAAQSGQGPDGAAFHAAPSFIDHSRACKASPGALKAVTASAALAAACAGAVRSGGLDTSLSATSVHTLQSGLVMHLSLPSSLPAPVKDVEEVASPLQRQSAQSARALSTAAVSGSLMHPETDASIAFLSRCPGLESNGLGAMPDCVEHQHGIPFEHGDQGCSDAQHLLSSCQKASQAASRPCNTTTSQLRSGGAFSTGDYTSELRSPMSILQPQASAPEPCGPSAAAQHPIPASAMLDPLEESSKQPAVMTHVAGDVQHHTYPGRNPEAGGTFTMLYTS